MPLSTVYQLCIFRVNQLLLQTEVQVLKDALPTVLYHSGKQNITGSISAVSLTVDNVFFDGVTVHKVRMAASYYMYFLALILVRNLKKNFDETNEKFYRNLRLLSYLNVNSLIGYNRHTAYIINR